MKNNERFAELMRLVVLAVLTISILLVGTALVMFMIYREYYCRIWIPIFFSILYLMLVAVLSILIILLIKKIPNSPLGKMNIFWTGLFSLVLALIFLLIHGKMMSGYVNKWVYYFFQFVGVGTVLNSLNIESYGGPLTYALLELALAFVFDVLVA